jgi:hypothetical protein
MSLSETAGELRQTVGKAMRWRTYIERHPGPVLGTTALLGFAVGRRLAHSLMGGPPLLTRLRSADEPSRESSRPLQKLDSRVEGLVNRVIDEVADAAERAVVPALVFGLQALFEGRRRAQSPGRPPAAHNTAEVTTAEGGS